MSGAMDGQQAAYWDDPERAAVVCSLLQQARPNWKVWREAGLWQARRNTWPEAEPPIFSADTAALDSLMGGIDDNAISPPLTERAATTTTNWRGDSDEA